MFEMLGLGLSIAGTVMGTSAANQAAGVSQNISGLELKVNEQRKNAMEVDARRRQLDVVRNNQRARSMAQTSATSQGSQLGSGLQGAYGQIGGQAGFNLQGINQNLEIGRNIFGLDTQISQNKITMAGLQGQEATASGVSAIGQSIFGAAKGAPGGSGFNMFNLGST